MSEILSLGKLSSKLVSKLIPSILERIATLPREMFLRKNRHASNVEIYSLSKQSLKYSFSEFVIISSAPKKRYLQ